VSDGTLLISGGTLVDERRVQRADLLIEGEHVAAVLEPGHNRSADALLDARALHVLPGMVDAHVHFNEPGRTEWEGFLTGTTAAAAGGVTTVCDMPLNSHPPTLDARALAMKLGAIADHARVDYALWGGVVPDSIAHLNELAHAGVIGVKAFLCDSGLAEYAPLDEFALLDAMQRCAELGLLLALHAEDAAETHRLGDAARARQADTAIDWARSRPPHTELHSVDCAVRLARETGARLHFVHISTAAAARRIGEARRDGLDVSVETCPHYLLLDETDLDRLGAFGKCAPPLRDRDEVEGLWQALFDGHIDWIASDHSPCPPTMKQTEGIWTAWGGLHGVQTSLAALLSEAVSVRGMALPDLVRLTSANPAQRLGLYPRKGALDVGSDADVALVDMNTRWTLEPAQLQTRWPVSPFAGRTFTAQVKATLVRGTLVWQDGEALVEPGFGRQLRA
jgi:allantoinase